ncbi:MAG: hypothetical protein ABI687_04575 [Flavitalea sp.]
MKTLKRAILFFLLNCLCEYAFTQTVIPGKALPEWKEGFMDLHHINTGRGNAAFYIFPDGTTMLLDAGELSPLDERTFTPRNASIKPDSSKKPYEWIVDYIRRVAPEKERTVLNYSLITHFHDDHFGAWYPSAPASSEGNYVLSGITGVGDLLTIQRLIDRGWPDYNYPYNIRKMASKYGGGEIAFNKTMQNYFTFTEWQRRSGLIMSGLIPGSSRQILLLRHPADYPDFFIRNVKENQWIWTGKDSSVANYFLSSDSLKPSTWADENALSLAITINYGPFSYYAGGDNPGNIFPGDNPFREVEKPIASAIGEMDVALMDHHGNRDAVSAYMIQTLRPSVWIGQTWSADHPGQETLIRLTSKYIYDHPGDLFATNMLQANRYVIGPLIDRSYKSQQGHIVVRVLPGGKTYYIIVLDDTRADIPVKAVFGPYTSKSHKTR